MRYVLQAAGACLIYLALVAAQRSPAGTIGDASAGKALFEGRGGCARCHTLDRRGGSIGPELSWIGLLRTPESLRRSLIDPDAEIHPRFFTVVVETRAGDRFEGLALNAHQLRNVVYVLGGESDPGLPERALDLVLIGHAYHEFSQPEPIMAAVRKSLRAGGRLVVLEYAKESPSAPASTVHRMSFDEMRSEIEPLGFDLERILDFLPVQHCLIFSVRP